MTQFFSMVKFLAGCGTVIFIATLILMALPQCKLRSIGLEMTKWVIAGGLVLLIPSPVDAIPDVLPGIGWVDDIGYALGAVAAAKSAMKEHRSRQYMDN